MSAALKYVDTTLDYTSLKGIPVKRVDRNLLRSGEANALLLVGYSNRDIKNGEMYRGNFKEYTREELNCFAEGMSTAMK